MKVRLQNHIKENNMNTRATGGGRTFDPEYDIAVRFKANPRCACCDADKSHLEGHEPVYLNHDLREMRCPECAAAGDDKVDAAYLRLLAGKGPGWRVKTLAYVPEHVDSEHEASPSYSPYAVAAGRAPKEELWTDKTAKKENSPYSPYTQDF